MLKGFSWQLLAITLFLSTFFLFCPSTALEQIEAVEVTPDTTVEEKDVVLLNYTLWVDNIVDDKQNGTVYVHDPEDSTVPSDIYKKYPDIHTPPNRGFMESLFGKKAGDIWTVTILFSSGKAFNNVSDRLYGEDLFYEIHLQKILVDASKAPVTLFDLPFFTPLLILFGLLLVILIALRIQRFNRTRNIFGLKTRCFTCKKLADIRCGNSGCNTPYCKKCFVENNGCQVCRSNTMVPLK